ncbi:MAG TPA: hypothetical protein VKB88_21270 [Bryobacteraceae bacterium]|nr:hypothetical protein [Bryobacteraceae bacterium]
MSVATDHCADLREVAAKFKTPPREDDAIQLFLSWNRPDAGERVAAIVRDLDRLSANGMGRHFAIVRPARPRPRSGTLKCGF